ATASTPAASSPTGVPPLPPVRARGWEITVERWLSAVIAPPYQPLDPAALAPFQDELREALAAAQAGSRAEAQAAAALQTGPGCPSARADGDLACIDLRPLVRSELGPSGTRAGARRPPAKPRSPR